MKTTVKVSLLLIAYLFTLSHLLSQEISFDYDRNSLSTLVLEFSDESLPSSFKQQFDPEVGHKYFFNPIASNHLGLPFKRPGEEQPTGEENSFKKILQGAGGLLQGKKKEKSALGEQIKKVLEEQNLGVEILKLWAQQNVSGDFEILQQRIDRNYTARDIHMGIDPQKLENIKPLFFRNYILVFDFENFGSYRDYYRNKQIEFTGSVPDGFIADLNVYFYKLEINDDLFNDFIVPNFDKPQVLETRTYPFAFKGVASFTPSKQRPDTKEGPRVGDEELFADLIDKGIQSAIFWGERNLDDFKAKDVIVEVKPEIKGEIGKREDVRLDQRFFAVEKKLNLKSGDTETRRIALLRATYKIANNQANLKDEQGNYKTTIFRKVYGKRLEPGMLLVQERDFRMTIGSGPIYRGGTMDIGFYFDYNVSSFLHEIDENIDFGGSRIFIALAIGKQIPGEPLSSDINKSTSRLGIGISKDLFQKGFIDVTPYLGYYFYTVTDRDYLNEKFLQLGLRFPITLYYNTYLVPEIGITTESKKEDISRFPLGATLRIDF